MNVKTSLQPRKAEEESHIRIGADFQAVLPQLQVHSRNSSKVDGTRAGRQVWNPAITTNYAELAAYQQLSSKDEQMSSPGAIKGRPFCLLTKAESSLEHLHDCHYSVEHAQTKLDVLAQRRSETLVQWDASVLRGFERSICRKGCPEHQP